MRGGPHNDPSGSNCIISHRSWLSLRCPIDVNTTTTTTMYAQPGRFAHRIGVCFRHGRTLDELDNETRVQGKEGPLEAEHFHSGLRSRAILERKEERIRHVGRDWRHPTRYCSFHDTMRRDGFAMAVEKREIGTGRERYRKRDRRGVNGVKSRTVSIAHGLQSQLSNFGP